jgi:hypothetical protein
MRVLTLGSSVPVTVYASVTNGGSRSSSGQSGQHIYVWLNSGEGGDR